MEKMGKKVLLLWIVCLPGLLSATCSSEDSIAISSNGALTSTKRPFSTCVNGVCNPDGTCVCNPCWSGPTCQDYVDRFAPRFLAEEPFFMVSVSSGEGREVPLFRIESADDDLGLTCQLGQVGPAATCPCATPRYKVVGPTQAVFRADQETGDVFIKPGFSLQSGKQYLITLQVSALEVNASGYHPWKEEVTSTLYVKRSGGRKPERSHYLFPQIQGISDSEQAKDFPHKSTSSASASTASPLTQLRSLWVPSGKQPELPSRERLNAFKSRSKRGVKSGVVVTAAVKNSSYNKPSSLDPHAPVVNRTIVEVSLMVQGWGEFSEFSIGNQRADFHSDYFNPFGKKYALEEERIDQEKEPRKTTSELGKSTSCGRSWFQNV